jgi:hypothetical protein
MLHCTRDDHNSRHRACRFDRAKGMQSPPMDKPSTQLADCMPCRSTALTACRSAALTVVFSYLARCHGVCQAGMLVSYAMQTWRLHMPSWQPRSPVWRGRRPGLPLLMLP